MGAPKGHPNYNTSKDPKKNGGAFGYLGRGEDYFTDQELKELGEGLLVWIQEKHNIWLKYYFNLHGIRWETVQRLYNRSDLFRKYMDISKEIQEGKLCTEPYYHLNKADGNHARFMLARHHKGEWQDKVEVESEDKSITFKVNYANGNNIEISSAPVSTENSDSSE